MPMIQTKKSRPQPDEGAMVLRRSRKRPRPKEARGTMGMVVSMNGETLKCVDPISMTGRGWVEMRQRV
jgi:hypothetical protein